VLEGTHGLYHAFAPSAKPDFAPLVEGLGSRWVMPTVAFKPYACGTMTQPFIDCAIALADSGVVADQIAGIVCDVGEGTVHRLWEPLPSKHRPPAPYAAKFSTPFCMAVGFFDRTAGFEQFTQARISDPAVLALCARITYAIDPANEYPRNFSGHLRATLTDGSVREIRQPYMRGGAQAPLSRAELERKFMGNAIYGGWSRSAAERLIDVLGEVFTLPRLDVMQELRS
jgi:2-methylcitrate dehydratase PrpD